MVYRFSNVYTEKTQECQRDAEEDEARNIWNLDGNERLRRQTMALTLFGQNQATNVGASVSEPLAK